MGVTRSLHFLPCLREGVAAERIRVLQRYLECPSNQCGVLRLPLGLPAYCPGFRTDSLRVRGGVAAAPCVRREATRKGTCSLRA
jgi:hypothetical protein